MSKHSTICAGIDTASASSTWRSMAGRNACRSTTLLTATGVVSAWLRRRRVKRVGIEASGGYEQPAVSQLRREGLVVIVFQPAQVRAYAKFHSQRAKNDQLDAALIAACTAAKKKIHAPPDPRMAAFAEHLTLIEQIGEDIAQLKTRRETCRDQRIRRLWDEEIARLKQLLRSEFEALIAAIRQHRDLADKLDLLASIDSVGVRTAVAILVRMPEIGRITRQQAAALAGLAPYDHDSGDHVGARHIDGGRERPRNSCMPPPCQGPSVGIPNSPPSTDA